MTVEFEAEIYSSLNASWPEARQIENDQFCSHHAKEVTLSIQQVILLHYEVYW